MSTILTQFQSFLEFVEEISDNGRVNGQFGNDSMIQLFRTAKDLESTIKKDFRSEIKEKLRERAKESGLQTEKGRPVVQGDELVFEFYQTGGKKINKGIIKEFFEDSLKNAETEEEIQKEIDLLFDLLRKNPFLKGQVSEKADQGLIPENSYERKVPQYKDNVEGNYWNVNRVEEVKLEKVK